MNTGTLIIARAAAAAITCAAMAMACQFNPQGVPAQGGDAGTDIDAGLPGPNCGDGFLNVDEQCDGENLAAQTCVSQGHAAGNLACNDNCTFDTSACLNPAEPWFNTAWAYRKVITIVAAEVAGDESDFPVVITLRDDPDLMAEARNDGRDILFTAADAVTKLDHEVEQYDSATGTLVAWVRVPALSSVSDTVLHVYYGNESASIQENPNAVWDSNFTAVYHLEGRTGGTFQDSSGAGNDGAESNFGGDRTVAGQIGMAQNLDGNNDHIAIPSAATDGHDRFTMCLWINTDESGGGVYYLRPSLIGQESFDFGSGDFGINSDNGALGMWSGLDGDNETLSGISINDGAWHHVCAVSDSSNVMLMHNGVGVDMFGTTRALNNKSFWLGGVNTISAYHAGLYDELQISDVDRSANWVQTSYNNQGRPDDFYTVGASEYYLQ